MNTQDRGQWTSASAAQADSLCPGRYLAQRDLPEPERGPDTQFGNAVHLALKTDDLSPLTREQRETYDACQAIVQAKQAEFFGPDVLKMKSNPIREKRFWVAWKNTENGIAREYRHSAQVDRVDRKGPRALIFEYKSLFGDTPKSPQNRQLRDQVVCVDANTPLLSEIGVVVVQPNVSSNPTITVYDRPSITQSRSELIARVMKSHDPNSPRVAGELQCEYCRAKLSCPEYHAFAASRVLIPHTILDTPCQAWTPEQWSAFCDGLPVAQKWLEEAKSEAKKRLKADPNSIPGFKLGTGRNRRVVDKPNELYGRFVQLGGTLEQYMDCVSIGLGVFTDKVSEVTQLIGKQLKSKTDALLDGLVMTSQDEPPIVKVKEEGK